MIKIEIIATEDKKNSPEYKGAEYLKEMFERDFKPIENGRIIREQVNFVRTKILK